MSYAVVFFRQFSFTSARFDISEVSDTSKKSYVSVILHTSIYFHSAWIPYIEPRWTPSSRSVRLSRATPSSSYLRASASTNRASSTSWTRLWRPQNLFMSPFSVFCNLSCAQEPFWKSKENSEPYAYQTLPRSRNEFAMHCRGTNVRCWMRSSTWPSLVTRRSRYVRSFQLSGRFQNMQ